MLKTRAGLAVCAGSKQADFLKVVCEMRLFHFFGMHKVTVEQDLVANRTDVLLDGKKISCRGFRFEQSVDTVPTFTLELFGVHKFNGRTRVGIEKEEMETLCRLADRGDLEEIVSVWNFCHDANLKLVDTTSQEDAKTSKT
jgi:hypothetical protein